MSVFISDDRLEALARKIRFGPYASAKVVPDKIAANVFSIHTDDKNFVFSNLQSMSGTVTLLGGLADNNSQKTQLEWWEYSKTNTEDVVVPNSRVLYQMMRGLYRSRERAEFQEDAGVCVTFFRSNFDARNWRHTGSKVVYKTGEEASVEHVGQDKQVHSIVCNVPEFTRHDNSWSYLVLANEQPESQLGVMETIPETAKSVLEALLGEGCEEAGAVFQYVSSRKDNNLREVRLWTPTLQNRNAERAVVLGVVDGGGGFGIYAYVGIYGSWPALGVVYVGVPKIPQEMKVA